MNNAPRVLRTIDEVTTAIARASATHSGSRMIVGIVGPPGAGKSTIAAQVVARLGASAALVPMDGFHLPQVRLVELQRRDRMGAPDTFDVDGLIGLLGRLSATDDAASAIRAPGFDRDIEEPVAGAIEIPAAASVIVLEGNYLLLKTHGWGAVAGQLDLSFFVEVDPELRRERLIARHIRFGKSPDAARSWALGPDEANARLIAGTESRADYLIALG